MVKTTGMGMSVCDLIETPVKRITDEEIEQRINDGLEAALREKSTQLEEEYNQKINDRYKTFDQEVEKKVKTQLAKTDDQTRCGEVKVRYVKLIESKIRELQTAVQFVTQPNTENSSELSQIGDELRRESSALKDYMRRCEVQRQDMIKLRKSEDAAKRQAKQILHETSSSHMKFEEVKLEAQNKLSVLYKQMKDLKTHHEAEKDKYELSVKKNELALKSLQQQLDQKNAENAELTKICDDLLLMGGKK